MCVVEEPGSACARAGRRGQTGNDEVIAKVREREKRKGGRKGVLAGRSDMDSEMSSAAEAWAAPSLPSLCRSDSPAGFGCCQCFVVTARGFRLPR